MANKRIYQLQTESLPDATWYITLDKIGESEAKKVPYSTNIWTSIGGYTQLLSNEKIGLKVDTSNGSPAFEIYDSSQTIGVSTPKLRITDEGILTSSKHDFLRISSNKGLISQSSENTTEDGTGNILLGYQAGKVLTSGGIFNTYIGYLAGKSVTTNAYDTIIGALAAENSNRSNSENTIIGYKAANAMISGHLSTIIGSNSLPLANPTSVVAIGEGIGSSFAGSINSTVLVGNEVISNANSAITIEESVAIGYRAGYQADQMKYNTLIGYQTGSQINARRCLFIGPYAGTYEDQDEKFGISLTSAGYFSTAEEYREIATIYGHSDLFGNASQQYIRFNAAMYMGGIRGAYYNIKRQTEEVTIPIGSGSAGVTTSASINLARNGYIKGCAAYVTQAPGAGATTFKIGITGSGNPDELINDLSTVLNTTGNSIEDNDGTDLPIKNITGDTTLTITTDINIGVSDMKIRIILWYEDITNLTS